MLVPGAGKMNFVGTYPLRQGSSIIGRRPECEVRLNLSSISRRHAMLHVDNGLVMLTDLESTNGTYVNGRQVKG
ncbi:FHA domain-containing protein, partial [Streptomyces galilaeus]